MPFPRPLPAHFLIVQEIRRLDRHVHYIRIVKLKREIYDNISLNTTTPSSNPPSPRLNVE